MLPLALDSHSMNGEDGHALMKTPPMGRNAVAAATAVHGGLCPQPNMTDWPHSPVHRLTQAGAYMITCGTYLKRYHFRGARRLSFLCDALLQLAAEYDWILQAWAVF